MAISTREESSLDKGVVCLKGVYLSPCVKKETPSSLENPGGGNESFEHHMDTTEKSNFLNLFHHPGTSTSARLDRIFTVMTHSTIQGSGVNHSYGHYICSRLQ